MIERPASVVKELLENALDAGANTLSIDIGFGGLNQVKISDNGSGICADDLRLAIAAHATSKIKHLNDLYTITSMGFRGEALASIASVSRLSLCSRTASQDHAMMLCANGETSVTPCARNQGTTVDVRDLFINAPVRKKFLKTALSEYQAIEAVVRRFALSAPMIAITLRHNDKQTLILPAAHDEQTRLLRIKKILGKTFIEQAVHLDVSRAGMRLEGWVSCQSYQRSQNDKQWVYINHRMVKDKLMTHAIKQAYESILYPGRHPACLLYLCIPADEVDVNVHPTKHEVRFQQPRLVHDFITSQISYALGLSASTLHDDDFSITEPRLPMVVREVNSESTVESGENVAVSAKLPPLSSVSYAKPGSHIPPPNRRPWQVLNTHFAVILLHNEAYLVDVARIQQHRLETFLSDTQYPLASRPLLVPVSCMIEKANYQWIEQCQPLLIQLGIQLDFASETRVIVRTIPLCVPSLDIAQLLLDLNNLPMDQSALLKRLVSCQSFDAHHLTAEEQGELTHYLQQQHPESSVRKALCVNLNRETCRSIVQSF